MIITTVILIIAIIATFFVCKTISSNFDRKDEALVVKEQALYAEQKDLRAKRRTLKRNLEELKRNSKEKKNTPSESEQKAPTESLKDWLEQKQSIESTQYETAAKFAKERNMNILSAMLTLDIISVQTYEEAKALKLLL